MSEAKALPVDQFATQHAARVVVPAAWKDSETGALYVHQDLNLQQTAWEEEAHIKPMACNERFGDVESFAAYVSRYGGKESLLTWNSQGIKAIIDYAEGATVGRRTWIATYPFVGSLQWQAWKAFANEKAIPQKTAVETLEDLAADITEPKPTDLMNLLRNLRASVNAKADAELRPDGTSSVSFSQDKAVKTASNVELPASFTIAIPVLKGHVDAEGRPVLYKLQVRLRASVDDSAHLTLRFSVPNSERVLEDVYADRVEHAQALLGDSFDLLRAAD